jgi:mRNA-degrading endonuclease RelE of RelBE toxin-antitoxin system
MGLRQSPLSRRRGEVAKIRDHDNVYRVTTLTARITYEIDWDEKRIIIHLVEPGA